MNKFQYVLPKYILSKLITAERLSSNTNPDNISDKDLQEIYNTYNIPNKFEAYIYSNKDYINKLIESIINEQLLKNKDFIKNNINNIPDIINNLIQDENNSKIINKIVGDVT